MELQSLDTRHLFICPECFEVCGRILLAGEKYLQPCSCDPPAAREILRTPEGYDFPTYVELCRACGLVAIPSGSRWSSFFCRECLGIIRQVNSAAGFALVPVGRHSVMNSIMLTGNEARDPDKANDFVEKFRGLNLRIDLLSDWRKKIVARRCADLGFSRHKQVPLGLFRRKASSLDSDSIRESTIHDLLEFFEVPEGGIAR
jgi:hypothetical protein